MCWLVHWKSAIFCPSLFIGQRHALLFNIQWIAGSQRSLERCIRHFSGNKPISSKSSNSGIACFNSFWEMSSEQVNHLSRLALFVGAIFVCDFSIVHQYRTQSNQIELHHILRPIVQYYCFHFKSPFANPTLTPTSLTSFEKKELLQFNIWTIYCVGRLNEIAFRNTVEYMYLY